MKQRMDLTSDDLVAIIKQAQHAGGFFADMIADSDEPELYRGTVREVDEMLDGQPLYFANDTTKILYENVPKVVRDAMVYVAWKSLHERSEELGPPRSYAGGKRRKGKRPHGAGLVSAARALKDIWR